MRRGQLNDDARKWMKTNDNVRQRPQMNTTIRKVMPGQLRYRDVRRRFEQAADTYARADFVPRHMADGLLERILPMRIEVKRALDAGSAGGSASRELRRRYKGSHIVSLDIAPGMLHAARKARSRFARISELQADATLLPFRDGSLDLVFANLLLPWIDDLPVFLAGVARVLRKDGLFVFSTLGPRSLRELREAWQTVDDAEHVNAFPDMHDIGDAVMQAGMREPVLDVEYLTVSYSSVQALFADLTAVGGRNCLRGRAAGLTGRSRFAAFRRQLETQSEDGRLSLPLELVFGHAWGGGAPAAASEIRFDPAAIGRRRR
jgi:malonyl-CoA O-methyltransferase